MTDIAIQVENLSKLYHIGRLQQRHDTLRDAIVDGFKSLRQRNGASADESLWALKDVSFEVKQGEVLGVIGRNGAGKSTLLKVLSRITEPTGGRAVINGRVGSLLEVGTGFHPELTGRENIYLNGAILGMRRSEIDRKFDEIVAFADVEKFLDTPVKRYSSGMYVRLAFAVAAHLEPEILLVDEVLAVGDAGFQKKCLGKMRDVADEEGKTVLFVSHNMGAVQTLCQSAILIEEGRLCQNGSSEEVITEYGRRSYNLAQIPIAERTDRRRSRDHRFRFENLHIFDEDENLTDTVRTGMDVTFKVIIKKLSNDFMSATPIDISIGICDHNGYLLTTLFTRFTGESPTIIKDNQEISCFVPKLPLVAGDYLLTIWMGVGYEVFDSLKDAAVLHVDTGNFFGEQSDLRQPRADWHGSMVIPHRWSTDQL